MEIRFIALLFGISLAYLIPEGYRFDNHKLDARQKYVAHKLYMLDQGPRKCMDDDPKLFEIRMFSEERWCSDYRRMVRNINAPLREY